MKQNQDVLNTKFKDQYLHQCQFEMKRFNWTFRVWLDAPNTKIKCFTYWLSSYLFPEWEKARDHFKSEYALRHPEAQIKELKIFDEMYEASIQDARMFLEIIKSQKCWRGPL